MKIVFVIPYFFPALQYGGQPRSAFELARGLARRGHQIKVLTTDSGGGRRLSREVTGERAVQLTDGIEVTYYRNVSNHLAFRHRLFWPPAFFCDLNKQLPGCDLIHIHELRSFLTVAAAAAAIRQRIPYVLSPHGGLRRLGKQRIKALYDLCWGNSILKRAAALIAVSPLEEKEALDLNVDPSRIRQIANAIALSDYDRLPRKGIFRDRYRIGNRKLVLFLGRLHWIKGADVLIQAFAKLCRDKPQDAHLVLAGPDDGQETELRKLISEFKLGARVTFTGFLDDREKNEALTDCDLLVVPSRSEVFAIAALEALACARPVVLSSACGLRPMPGRECGVCFFESGDAAVLSVTMSDALNDRNLAEGAGRAREFVDRHFSVAAIAARAESVYKEILRNSSQIT